MAAKKSITKWNVLALATILIGGGAVLLIDHLWIAKWSATGQAFPIAQRRSLQLPAGESLVYYESPHSVPIDSVTLYLWDEDGDRIFLRPLAEDVSYRILLNGWSGRALWRLNLPNAGKYSFKCDNHNYNSDAEIPKEDRVVFLKEPDSLLHIASPRRTVQMAGMSLIVIIAAMCYIRHARVVRATT